MERGTAAGQGRVIARLLTLCALLTGVFLMHGLPAQACAGGAMAEHGIGHAMPAPPMAGLPNAAPASEHGSVCVSTPPPRGWAALLLLLLLAVVLISVSPPLSATRRFARFLRHRAPPRPPDLLTTLCVSRT
ncbi:hypothetical protein ACFWY9_26430 [Amycolatopsis sp. NPDC059027]|uniref:hypothetical protein n=1 Tax=unclassified Amycolatopsis TaxID=2618356 RepID=UPI0036733F62